MVLVSKGFFSFFTIQGEGAPTFRKGTCANHIHEVAKIFTGAQLTLTARCEDDIDLDRIMKKLINTSTPHLKKQNQSGAVQGENPRYKYKN